MNKDKNKHKKYSNAIQLDKSQCKCLADQVLLYIRYACPILSDIAGSRSYTNAHDNIFKRPTKDESQQQQRLKRFQEYSEYLYKECVRGDIIGNPRIMSAGVLYVAAVMTKTYVSQQDIAELLGISEVSVRPSYKRIKLKAQKQGIFN